MGNILLLMLEAIVNLGTDQALEASGSSRTMPTCTLLTDPFRYSSTGFRSHRAPTDTPNSDGFEQACRYGLVYEFEGRVALTGAGAYHAEGITGGMLGG